MAGILDNFTDWLIESATIQRAADAPVDEAGSGRKDYLDIATDVPCQLQISQGAFIRALYGDNPTRSGTLFLMPDVDIRTGDRVVVKGETWLVESIEDLRDTMLDHLEAQLSRVGVP